jgi:23S rRNA (uracil1939-C5)-methyltransferase
MEVRNLAKVLIGSTGPLAGVVWKGEPGGARRDHQGRMQVLAGRSHVVQKLGPYRYRVPAGCFFQANVALAADLFKEVARRCRAGNEGVLELHSGVGSLTLFLGGMGHRVLAVEGDPSAVSAAKFNGRYNAVTGVEFRCEDVEQALHRLGDSGGRFGTVVTDPPRSGLPPGTARELGRLARHSILYVSCNPATLARDLREITAGKKWRLEEVLPFDLFPQTAEIECLAELRDDSDS